MVDEQAHLIKQRKEAYAFIIEYFNNVRCNINQTKDTAVAEFSGISLEELIALKNGEANPSKDLITKVHQANISAAVILCWRH
jgi:hypothetical protein